MDEKPDMFRAAKRALPEAPQRAVAVACAKETAECAGPHGVLTHGGIGRTDARDTGSFPKRRRVAAEPPGDYSSHA